MKKMCSSNQCTGCGACVNVCPKKCIRLAYDKDGFLQPCIAKNQCIDCKMCVKRCPSNHMVEKNAPQKAVVACSENDEIVLLSSSGGIFSELAKTVLNAGGIVCGAVFDDDYLNVNHVVAKNDFELSKMRGSKYIQSNTRNIYKEVKDFLCQGKSVLFSGTPCQAAGLKSYLGSSPSNLITVDFICHGVVSSKAYWEYLKSFDIQGKICDVKFRYKQNNNAQHENQLFRVCTESGIQVEENWQTTSLGYAFKNNLLSRESCSSCKYSTVSRVSDITIGDYIADIDSEPLNKSGKAKSLILVNTEAGANELSKVMSNLLYSEISIQKAVSVSRHLSFPAVQHKNRKKVFRHLGKSPWNELAERYFAIYRPIRTFKSIKNKILHFTREV